MKVGEIYGKNRNKKLLVMYIDFFLMTLFGGIYNIYTSKNYYIYLHIISYICFVIIVKAYSYVF